MEKKVINNESELMRLFSFKGRIRRSNFVKTYIYCVALTGVFNYLFTAFLEALSQARSEKEVIIGWVVFCIDYAVVYVPLLWVYIAQAVKRFHDINKSGWYYFGYLVPLYNLYLLAILFFKDGDPHENKYGPDPKGRGVGEGEVLTPIANKYVREEY